MAVPEHVVGKCRLPKCRQEKLAPRRPPVGTTTRPPRTLLPIFRPTSARGSAKVYVMEHALPPDGSHDHRELLVSASPSWTPYVRSEDIRMRGGIVMYAGMDAVRHWPCNRENLRD